MKEIKTMELYDPDKQCNYCDHGDVQNGHSHNCKNNPRMQIEPESPITDEEIREVVVRCAKTLGKFDAENKTTIPPPAFCEDTEISKALRAAWIEGYYSITNNEEK